MPLTICPDSTLRIYYSSGSANVFKIIAWIAENCFSILDAPVMHCASLDTPVPFSIELEIILKDPDLMVEADASLIEQVLINLVVNAADAVKEKADPRILLSAYITPNNKVVIKIADNGYGMPEELMEKIFIPFFSTRKTGSGIGLSLCKQIMLLHKGTIQVQSVEGEGSAFLLYF